MPLVTFRPQEHFGEIVIDSPPLNQSRPCNSKTRSSH